MSLLTVVAGRGKSGHEAPRAAANIPLSEVHLKRNVDVLPVKQDRMASFAETVGYLEAEGQTDAAGPGPRRGRLWRAASSAACSCPRW